MSKMNPNLPERPLFEDPGFEHDEVVSRSLRDFCEGLRRDGVAEIDLGAEGRALCDQAIAEMERFFRSGKNRVQDAWFVSPAVRQLATHPLIHERLSAAYGRQSFAFQTLNFERGSGQALHSDAIHFNSEPEKFMCGVWIALEDVTPEAGPLTYVLGSHSLPRLSMRDVGVERRGREADYPRFVEALNDQLAESNLPRREALLKKGQAMVWTSNLAHGGSPIARGGSTRRSLVVHCFFEDSVYFTPLKSDEARGRLFVRSPCDIATGRLRWSRRNGRPIPPSPMAFLGVAGRRLLRRPKVD